MRFWGSCTVFTAFFKKEIFFSIVMFLVSFFLGDGAHVGFEKGKKCVKGTKEMENLQSLEYN